MPTPEAPTGAWAIHLELLSEAHLTLEEPSGDSVEVLSYKNFVEIHPCLT